MKSISDFKKRIIKGQKIKLCNCDNLNHKYLGIVRTISKVQTNGFYMATDEQIEQGKKGSWLDFPKLSNVLEFKENGIKLKTWPDNPENKEFLEYEFV